MNMPLNSKSGMEKFCACNQLPAKFYCTDPLEASDNQNTVCLSCTFLTLECF